MDVTEAEDVKRGGKNTHKNYFKKDLHIQDNHDDVITHLEPDILECEVKWALGIIIMNKASGGDGIPVELFQILKDNAEEGFLISPCYSLELCIQMGICSFFSFTFNFSSLHSYL